MKLQDVWIIQVGFKSDLNQIRKEYHKHIKQKEAKTNIFYNSREAVIELFDYYTTI